MTQRLGGFARLGIVMTVLWTGLMAWAAWSTMPKQIHSSAIVTALARRLEPPTVWDPQTKKLLTQAEADRRTRDARNAMTETERAAVDASVALSNQLQRATKDQIIYVEGRGFVRLKAGQTVQEAIAQPERPSLDDAELLSLLNDPSLKADDLQLLTDDERVRLQQVQRNAEDSLNARRITHIQAFVGYWLLPIALMYALAYTMRWIYRGFRQSAT